MEIRPQPGAQEMFLSSPADIVIYGGAAGGGKTYALLMEPLRHINNPKFGAVIFRKNANQIFNEGGLWDSAFEIYPYLGATPIKSPKPMWRFPRGMKVSFAHIEMDKDLLSWQGTQIALVAFDELTHFSENQFFYMLSRNRSLSGVRPYIRATTNPDADSWVAGFISWWIDQKSGYPIPERSGKIRYMVRQNGKILWGNSVDELVAAGIESKDIKSVTFIAATLADNKILMKKDPGYLANLKALPYVERERLLGGNWKVRPAAGLYFKRSQISEMMDVLPTDVVRWVRRWDLAATEDSDGNEPAYTAGVLMGKRSNGRYIVADVINLRQKASAIRDLIKNTAIADRAKFGRIRTMIPQDPGQAGKDQVESYTKFMAGFDFGAERETGSKVTRAEPMAAQWQAGNFDILIADWNDAFFSQLESFPESKFKDMVDAADGAFTELERAQIMAVPSESDDLIKESYWNI